MMHYFDGPLNVQLASKEFAPKIILLEDLVWILDHETGEHIRVPKGFECDGISVPRPLWSYIPPIAHPAVRAAVIHDYLCAIWSAVKNDPDFNVLWTQTGLLGPLTKREIDQKFKDALKASGINFIVANLLYTAIRAYSLVVNGE